MKSYIVPEELFSYDESSREEVRARWKITDKVRAADRYALDTYLTGPRVLPPAEQLAENAAAKWLTDDLHIYSVHGVKHV